MADIVIKTKLLDNTEITWDKRWIKSLQTNVQSTSDPSAIQYGAIDSSGSATIIDIDGSIYQNIINGNLKKDNLDIQIYLNGKQVRNHIVTDSNYDKNTNILSLTLQGLFYKLAQEDYAGVSLNVNKTAYELTSKVLSDFGYTIQQIHNALSNNIVVGDYTMESIENYLKSIVIPYSFIKRDGKKIDAINEICKLAQLQAFEDDDGNIKFVSARPSFSKTRETINVINANCQYSPFDSAIILKNKIASVGYKSNNSYISGKKNDVIPINTYDQTDAFTAVSIDGDTRQFYSGLLSDYQQNLAYETTKENGFHIFGNYPISGGDNTDKDRALVCKYTFDTNKYILDDSTYSYTNPVYEGKKSIFIPVTTSENNNVIAFAPNIQFSSANKYGLKYTSKNISVNIGEDVGLSLFFAPNFVNSEQEALSALCNMNGSAIQSVKPSQWFNLIQIVKNDNLYTCYFCRYYVSEHLYNISPSFSNYTGDINEISLNFNLSMFIRCLIESYSDVDTDSDFVLPQGYLFHSDATVDGKNLYNSVKQDILTDYADGISNGTITISFADYYDTNGVKTKNKDNGDVFNIGELVRIDRDNSGHSAREYSDTMPMLWKIVGRKIRKDNGVIFIDLNLSECKARSAQQYTLSKGISTVTRTYSPSGASTGVLTNSDPIYEGDALTITYSGGVRSYTITNGETQITGSDLDNLEQTITVSGDVLVSITAKQWHWVRYVFDSGFDISKPTSDLEDRVLWDLYDANLDNDNEKAISAKIKYYEGWSGAVRTYNLDKSSIDTIYVDQQMTSGYKGILFRVANSDSPVIWCYPENVPDRIDYNEMYNFGNDDKIAVYKDSNNHWYIKRVAIDYSYYQDSYLTQISDIEIYQREYS